MFHEEMTTSDHDASFTSDAELHGYNLQNKHEAPQMKIFMDYCYYIEKLWLDWKLSCLRSFAPNDK